MSQNLHKSVLLEQLVDNVLTDKNGVYFDATFGRGGHTEYLAEKLDSNAKIIACDVDGKAFFFGKEKFKNDHRIIFYNTNFSNIDIIAKIEFVDKFDGIMADLGVSSPQYDDVEYGFTFKEKAPLDLRLDKSINLTAADVLNEFEQNKIADIIFQFGEDKNAKKIAKEIVKFREKNKFVYTTDLVETIKTIVPPNYLNKTLSRVFQSLRIYINSELEVLEKFVKKSIDLLKTNGRLGIITFHSLEDRVVKEIFNKESKGCICPPNFPVCVCSRKPIIRLITKKPIVPDNEELKNNFRARSAKLRVIEKL